MASENIAIRPVFLATTRDWPHWFSHFKSIAKDEGIWSYCNPDADDTDADRPLTPKRPTMEQAKAKWKEQHGKDMPTEAQLTHILSRLDLDYGDDQKIHEKRSKACSSLFSWIRGHIRQDHLDAVIEFETIRAKVRELRRRNLGDAQKEASALMREWESLSAPKSPTESSEKWVRRWEETYPLMKQLYPETVRHPEPVFKFVTAMEKVDPRYGTQAHINLSNFAGDYSKLPSLKVHIENWKSLVKSMGTIESQTQSAMMTTAQLNGQAQQSPQKYSGTSSTNGKGFENCVCGAKHRFIECFYLNPKKRPKYFKLKPDIIEKINNALKTNLGAQRAWKRCNSEGGTPRVIEGSSEVLSRQNDGQQAQRDTNRSQERSDGGPPHVCVMTPSKACMELPKPRAEAIQGNQDTSILYMRPLNELEPIQGQTRGHHSPSNGEQNEPKFDLKRSSNGENPATEIPRKLEVLDTRYDSSTQMIPSCYSIGVENFREPQLAQNSTEFNDSSIGPLLSKGSTVPAKNITAGLTAMYSASRGEIDQCYELKDSFILDSGATIHCCNNRSRFIDYRQYSENILTGNGPPEVRGIGTVLVNVSTPRGPEQIRLLNTRFVPSMPTSVISYRLMKNSGAVWNDENGEILLKSGNSTSVLCYVEDHCEQWTLEYNIPGILTLTTPAMMSMVRRSHTRPISQATALKWHQRVGHFQKETVEKLPEACSGVKIIEGDEVPQTSNCGPCAHAKHHEIISRIPRTKSERPWDVIHIDMLHHNEGYNNCKIVCQATDDCSKYRIIWSAPQKSILHTAFRELIEHIRTQYQAKIREIRMDNERGISDEDRALFRSLGIVLNQTPPYSHSQNGAAENAGKQLEVTARVLRIQSQLPEVLWPVFVSTAAYLLNRRPLKQLDWKTPYEVVRRAAKLSNPVPDLSHLRVIGCRAYVLKHNVPKTQKVASRAHSGYLVGYAANNIFYVWLPIHNKVIKSRNVIFDESVFWDANRREIEDYLVTAAPMEIPSMEMSTPASTRVLEDVRDDEDDEIEYEEIRLIPHNRPLEIQPVVDRNEGVRDETRSPSASEPIESESTPTSEIARSSLTHETTPELPEPDSAPECNNENDPQPDEVEHSNILQSNQANQRNNIDGLNPSDIIPGGRTRSATRHAAIYIAQNTSDEWGFHSIFSMALSTPFKEEIRAKIHQTDLLPAPKNYKEMQRHQYRSKWEEAMKTEWNTLWGKQTFETTPKEAGSFSIPQQWVYTYKFDENGVLTKFKARLCVRGDLQPPNEQENYAATLAVRTFRFLVSLINAFDLETAQYDAVNAFPNCDVDEEVYVQFPPGFERKGSHLRLKKALYGLRQSPRIWQEKLTSILTKMGLRQVTNELCLFTNGAIFVFFFVDDIVTAWHRNAQKEWELFDKTIRNLFEIRSLGELKWFLNIRCIRDRSRSRIWLCQDSYIEKITARFHVNKSANKRLTGVPLPLSRSQKPHEGKQNETSFINLYQQKVGAANYLAVQTRPDIAKAASLLSERLQNPDQSHMDSVNHLLEYLASTAKYGLVFDANKPTIEAYSDAAYADDAKTRKSSMGYLLKLYGAAIDWKATKQRSVVTSTTEAELHALTHAAKEILHLWRLFESLGFSPGTKPAIFCDNKQTIRLITSKVPQFQTRLRHVDVHHHWLRQEVQEGNIEVNWVPTAQMEADGLTKMLSTQQHRHFMTQLGLEEVTEAQLNAHDPQLS